MKKGRDFKGNHGLLARQKGFEPPTFRLGGQSYPFCGVYSILVLASVHILRVFKELRDNSKHFFLFI